MTSYAPLRDQRVVEAEERLHREQRIATVLVHDIGPHWTLALAARLDRHIANIRAYEQQAKAVQT